MSKKEDFVKFDKVDKSYEGKVLVVKDLNLDIKEGEFVTMLGPSGSGKTTCLLLLAGFETPTTGEIYLDKNYAAIFIFWDFLFRTFQEELEKEPPVY